MDLNYGPSDYEYFMMVCQYPVEVLFTPVPMLVIA